jgi:hypothetical protein
MYFFYDCPSWQVRVCLTVMQLCSFVTLHVVRNKKFEGSILSNFRQMPIVIEENPARTLPALKKGHNHHYVSVIYISNW